MEQVSGENLPFTNFESGHGAFYYDIGSNDGGEVPFAVQRPFNIGYRTPCNFLTWYLPVTCTPISSTVAYNQTDTNTIINGTCNNIDVVSIQCTQTGENTFHVYRDNDVSTADTFAIILVQDGCYRWVMTIVTNETESIYTGTKNNSALVMPSWSNSTARIWLIDPLRSSDDELLGLAYAPSLMSRQITKAAYLLGEQPFLSAPTDYEWTSSDASYDTQNDFWTITITSGDPYQVPVTLDDRGVTVLNCQGETRRFVVNLLNFTSGNQGAFIPFNGVVTPLQQEEFQIFRGSCAPNVAVAISSTFGGMDRFLFTQDNFEGDQYLYTLALPNGMTYTSINSVIITTVSIVFMTDTGVFLTQDLTTMVQAQGLPDNIDSMSGVNICDQINDPKVPFNQFVFAWRSGAPAQSPTPGSPQTGQLYFSMNGGDTFDRIIDIPLGSGSQRGFIWDVDSQLSLNQVNILVRDSLDTDRMVLYDLTTGNLNSGYQFQLSSIQTQELVALNDTQTELEIVAVVTGSGELFVKGSTLFYSMNGGVNMFQVNLLSRDPQRPATELAANETLEELVTTASGKVVVRTSWNRLFYSNIGLPQMLELYAGTLSTDLVSCYCDALDRILILTPVTGIDGKYIQSQIVEGLPQLIATRYPVYNNPSLICPFSSFTSTLLNGYYLDTDGQIDFETFLVTNNVNDFVSVAVTNPNVAAVTNQRDFTFNGGVQVATSNVTVLPSSATVPGKTDLRVTPSRSNLGCETTQLVTVINFNCLPSRSLVANDTRNWTSCADFSKTLTEYQLPALSYYIDYAKQLLGQDTKTLEYDCDKYGIPILAYFGDTFSPSLALFDGGNALRQIQGNFILFEDNGRQDFKYSQTFSTMKCATYVMDWEQAMQLNGTQPLAAWPSRTNQDCYDSTGPALTSTQGAKQYVILNATSTNSIIWQSSADGIYLFTAVVLDPNESFCQLTTQFAVQIYGAPIGVDVELGISFGIVGLVFIGLGMTYVTHQKLFKKEKVN